MTGFCAFSCRLTCTDIKKQQKDSEAEEQHHLAVLPLGALMPHLWTAYWQAP